MAMDNKIREYLNDVFFEENDYISQYKLLRQITDNYDKDLINGLFKEIVRYYWDNADKYKEYQKEKEWYKTHYYPPEKLYTQSPTKDYHKEYLLMPPIMEDSISILDSQIEVLSKLAVNNHEIKFIIGHIYKQIPMLPPIYEPVVKRTPQQEQEFCLEVLKKISDWLNEPNLYQYNESILFRYKDINIESICEAYNQYETLYNGVWVQLGNFPEDGQYNPNPKEREQALNILRGLYDIIKPYEQQIKADMECLEGDLRAYPHIKEKISCMANICRDYHDRIEFVENIIVKNRQKTTSTTKQIPSELTTNKAKEWLQVAINGGLLNEDYSPTNKLTTKAQKALLAEELSRKIFGTPKYKIFEILWGCEKLAQTRYKSREEVGKVKGGECIMKLFK